MYYGNRRPAFCFRRRSINAAARTGGLVGIASRFGRLAGILAGHPAFGQSWCRRRNVPLHRRRRDFAPDIIAAGSGEHGTADKGDGDDAQPTFRAGGRIFGRKQIGCALCGVERFIRFFFRHAAQRVLNILFWLRRCPTCMGSAVLQCKRNFFAGIQ